MFDLIIIGGSAAATAAGVYAARRNLNFKIICKDFGGEIATSGEIGNWPGVIKTDGIDLSEQFRNHLRSYNVGIEDGVWVERVSKQDDGLFCVTAKSKSESAKVIDRMPNGSHTLPKCDYLARTLIVATGVHPRELKIPGEKEFRNKGLSYCTTCDGPLFSGKTVATIGGGNSALESGLMLADIASKVFVINKNAEFKGDQVLIDNLLKKNNVEIIYEALASQISGEQFVTSLKYKNKNGNEEEIKVDGIFAHIGMVPNSGIVSDDVFKNKFGEIMVNANCETNIPGLYAAGDVTDVPFKQIVVAAGQGCIATLSAVQYLNKQENT